MDSRKVTIIIPAYNQAQYLGDAIESALNQTIKCNIIVVNDGSTDNTNEVAMKYPIDFLIEKPNGGLSSARNTGIQKADTKWILCLDADDKIAPDFIEKCLQYIDKYDIIGTGQQEFGDSDRVHIFDTNPTYEMFRIANRINCCSLFKKEMWKDIGGYDETMRLGYEDWDFWLRATKIGYKVGTVQEVLFFYRKHGVSMITETVKHHQELLEYMLNKND